MKIYEYGKVIEFWPFYWTSPKFVPIDQFTTEFLKRSVGNRPLDSWLGAELAVVINGRRTYCGDIFKHCLKIIEQHNNSIVQ